MLLADRVAGATIRIGGVCVIVAVLGILIYLVGVVLPLFAGASVSARANYALLDAASARGLLFATVDEYLQTGLCALANGEIFSFDASTGRVLARDSLLQTGPRITAFAQSAVGDGVVYGFADGTVRPGRLGFRTVLDVSGSRSVNAVISIEDPRQVATGGDPITLLDYHDEKEIQRLVVHAARGGVIVHDTSMRANLLTGEETHETSTTPIVIPDEIRTLGAPSFLRITARGEMLLVAWSGGTVIRYDLSDPDKAVAAERAEFTSLPETRLTALRFMIGDQSILAADSGGGVRAWFPVSRWSGGIDGYAIALAHTLAPHGAPVQAIAVSTRNKSILTGAADGTLLLHHLTTGSTLVRTSIEPASPILTTQITPKADAIFAVSADGRATLWNLSNPHPEASWRAFFGKVWYEGHEKPAFTWQSSSGTDDFEPKLSLVPLVFGTLKATLFSMLFAVPIAVCAALYTSEFLHRRYKSPLKSLIEMMASLPSVVLGFIAAIVLAPLVQRGVIGILLACALIPIGAILLGHLSWRMPRAISRQQGGAAGWAQVLTLCGLVLLAGLAARLLSPMVEATMFSGDFHAWLDGKAGTGAPGIAIIAWPAILVMLLVLDSSHPRFLAGKQSRAGTGAGRNDRGALWFLIIVAASIILSALVAIVGSWAGLDPRGGLVGTYMQRNALVVGFVMGFAIIPVIYTVAEDALRSVPDTLRAASYGCGATRWQTATRVVLPLALPGIFSAAMIGLGRAAGETMIVLMAAGNTPVLDINPFNGLRTLSANIAVELPEAARDGTLYRVLFLAALLLFVGTFILNTVAEIVRQRFRRRSAQL